MTRTYAPASDSDIHISESLGCLNHSDIRVIWSRRRASRPSQTRRRDVGLGRPAGEAAEADQDPAPSETRPANGLERATRTDDSEETGVRQRPGRSPVRVGTARRLSLRVRVTGPHIRRLCVRRPAALTLPPSLSQPILVSLSLPLSLAHLSAPRPHSRLSCQRSSLEAGAPVPLPPAASPPPAGRCPAIEPTTRTDRRTPISLYSISDSGGPGSPLST